MPEFEFYVAKRVREAAEGSELLINAERWSSDPEGQAVAQRLQDAWRKARWTRRGGGRVRFDPDTLDELAWWAECQARPHEFDSRDEADAYNEARAIMLWARKARTLLAHLTNQEDNQ